MKGAAARGASAVAVSSATVSVFIRVVEGWGGPRSGECAVYGRYRILLVVIYP